MHEARNYLTELSRDDEIEMRDMERRGRTGVVPDIPTATEETGQK